MKFSTYAVGAALVASWATGGVSLSRATTILKADVATLTQASDAVVQARVTGVQSAWNAERTIIFTHVTLNVARAIRGSAADGVVVRVPGGSVAGFTIQMEGAPKFEKNSNVVVFLGRWDDGAVKVVGYHQGLSRVVPDRLGNPILRGEVQPMDCRFRDFWSKSGRPASEEVTDEATIHNTSFLCGGCVDVLFGCPWI